MTDEELLVRLGGFDVKLGLTASRLPVAVNACRHRAEAIRRLVKALVVNTFVIKLTHVMPELPAQMWGAR